MASAFSNYMDKLDNFIGQNEVVDKYLSMVEKKTNVKKRYIALGLVGALALWLYAGVMASLICNIIGFAYPAFKTVKAIESTDKNDDTEWLMYWVVFSTFSCVEFFSDILLSWFPFYFLGKCVFLIWCMAPTSYNGSKILYSKLIRPFILKHENKIDGALGNAMGNAKNMFNTVQEEANKAVAHATSEAVKNALSGDEKKEE